jgi:Asp-tRNA(Asn)/Glu-tRNA(Gln) amidotransferase A subunit family amidase
MRQDEYVAADGLELANRVRTGEVDAAAVMAACRERIGALNPELNAVIAVIDPPQEASERKDAPFLGVPFMMKDIGAGVKDVPTVAASRYFLTSASPGDDALTLRFRAAGLRIVGKTSLPELGFNVTTEPSLYGPTCNPWDVTRTAGGSSGGAAAAVAGGMVPIAHATDGAGSIRIPAACCGLVGLKPSRGVVPLGPRFTDVYGGLVSEGVVSRTVRDTAAALDACGGEDDGAPYASPLGRPSSLSLELRTPARRLRIGVVGRPPPDVDLSSEVVAGVDRAAAMLASLGHQVARLDLPFTDAELFVPRQVYKAHVCVQSATDRRDEAEQGRRPRAGDLERINMAAAARGSAMAAVDFVSVIRRGHEFARRLSRVWGGCDVLLSAALSELPPPLGRFPTDHDDVDLHVDRMARFAPFASLFNLSGGPAIVLPVALSAGGLPVAVQLGGPLGRDGEILQLAAELEAVVTADGYPAHRLAPMALA